MKGKYINTQILLACLSTRNTNTVNMDIHIQLQETIAELRRTIIHMNSLRLSFKPNDFNIDGKDAA